MLATLTLLVSIAFAGQPGGTAQVAPKAPSAPMTAAAPNPGAAIPATPPHPSNAPLGRPGVTLGGAEQDDCYTLDIHNQALRATTAQDLMVLVPGISDACARLLMARAAATVAVSQSTVTTTWSPDGSVTETKPATQAPGSMISVGPNGTTVTTGGLGFGWGGGQSMWGTGGQNPQNPQNLQFAGLVAGVQSLQQGTWRTLDGGGQQPTQPAARTPPAKPTQPAAASTPAPPPPNPAAAAAIVAAGQR